MSSTRRRILREMARRKMKDEGHRKINKHSHYGHDWQKTVVPSYFANHWREYV